MEDKTIVCVDCQQAFVFSVGEQQFYAERGLTELPKRCKTCRHARRRRLGRRRRQPQEGAPRPEPNGVAAGAAGSERGAGERSAEPEAAAPSEEIAANRRFWDDRPQWVRDAMAKALPPTSAPGGNGTPAARGDGGNGTAPQTEPRRRRRRPRRRGRRPQAQGAAPAEPAVEPRPTERAEE